MARERRSLITKLEELSKLFPNSVEFIKNGTTQKFNTFITHELENQDQLRKLLEKEKNLNIDIKKTQQEKNLEKKEHDKEVAENIAKIQEIKSPRKRIYRTISDY